MPVWLIETLKWGSMILLLVVGLLLMGIILLQRGRGGGLAGAFGGMGGQSAFGTKAGDVFTKITIVMAVIWVLLAGT
ncbi:MAG TPA: preprotein translocase subunit SecG, partial [Planctomycetaceae bacterium]|nr:preprotein translocase subunit SecG [Planctomycetaceae bacterium]